MYSHLKCIPVLNKAKYFFLFLLLVMMHHCSGHDILSSHHQLLVVTTSDWNEIQGTIQLFERDRDGCSWIAIGQSMPAVIGKNGLAWGIGLHPHHSVPLEKREGDKKSPAGIFSIGTAFGFASKTEMNHLQIEYLPLDLSIEAVDDPLSAYYNMIVHNTRVKSDWNSSEKMSSEPLYELGFAINHNFPNPQPEKGSAIFFHIWRNSNSGTAGCTATSKEYVSTILSWLKREKNPVIVQLPKPIYFQLKNTWQLPELP